MSGMSLDDIFAAFKTKYAKVRELLDNRKNDLSTEPYKSCYAARDLLDEMKALITHRIDSISSDESTREISMLAGILYLYGCINMDVDENSAGEDMLLTAYDLIKDSPIHPDNVVIVLSTLNQLGLLYCDRGEHGKSLSYLEDSDRYYESYCKQHDDPPNEFQELLTGTQSSVEKQADSAFEKCHTLTLYYLAQVCQLLGQTTRAAVYCHTTLKRQLESKDFDKIDWALNAATLSQFLVEKCAFKEARHHLSAASHIINLRQMELDSQPSDSEEYKANVEQLRHRKSDVARCWTKYCLNLLSSSRERLMSDSMQTANCGDDLCGLSFPSLVLEESIVPCEFLLTFADAKPVFLAGQNWLNEAAGYYTLEDHASDHVAIVKDHSQLYLQLAFFEEDESRQCKMHKRRVDMLSNLSEQISPQFYIDLLRELWFETAEALMTMIDIKSNQASEQQSNQNLSKINNLILQSVGYYKKFFNSFRDEKSGNLPLRYPETYERCILLSQIYSAKLYTKISTGDIRDLIDYNTLALQSYKSVVNYCDNWKDEFSEESHPLTRFELTACTDMAHLLPLKLNKLSHRLA